MVNRGNSSDILFIVNTSSWPRKMYKHARKCNTKTVRKRFFLMCANVIAPFEKLVGKNDVPLMFRKKYITR